MTVRLSPPKNSNNLVLRNCMKNRNNMNLVYSYIAGDNINKCYLSVKYLVALFKIYFKKNHYFFVSGILLLEIYFKVNNSLKVKAYIHKDAIILTLKMITEEHTEEKNYL